MKSVVKYLLICSLLLIAAGVDENNLLSLENKYIKIYINNSNEETGRFAVDQTNGDPKPLLYGHPKPWTSFTTIRINGQNYVFGKATTKRSGAGVPGGSIVEPPTLIDNSSLSVNPSLSDNQLIMKCQYDTVTATQILESGEKSEHRRLGYGPP